MTGNSAKKFHTGSRVFLVTFDATLYLPTNMTIVLRIRIYHDPLFFPPPKGRIQIQSLIGIFLKAQSRISLKKIT